MVEYVFVKRAMKGAVNGAVKGAVKVAVRKNLVAVKGLQVAVVLTGSGSEGLLGPGNPDAEQAGPLQPPAVE